MIGYIHIGEIIVLILYGSILLGVGALVRKYPETISGISTLPKQAREKLNLPKIGAFLSKGLNVSATVVFLAILIPKQGLRWQVAVIVPLFLILLSAAYLAKYRTTRFKKEE